VKNYVKNLSYSISSTDSDENYFINEVETIACNLLPEETKYPIIEKLANVIYHFTTKVKGDKEPPLIHSKYGNSIGHLLYVSGLL
jgi:hypothetical protein